MKYWDRGSMQIAGFKMADYAMWKLGYETAYHALIYQVGRNFSAESWLS